LLKFYYFAIKNNFLITGNYYLANIFPNRLTQLNRKLNKLLIDKNKKIKSQGSSAAAIYVLQLLLTFV
jgi:hypothetical protein